MDKIDDRASVQYSAGELTQAIAAELNAWQKEGKVQRLWAGDASLWTNAEESQWLGWLNIAAEMVEVPQIEALAKQLSAEKISDLVVLGMGGSSLCPAMMAKTFAKFGNAPRLHILDSTDPAQIRHLEERLDLKTTYFIVSSKSGSTLEPNIFKAYFEKRLQDTLKTQKVGDRFIAITDPGSSLDKMASSEGFKAIFHGVPSIGGRYSALSNFGMVPSGLMGVDIAAFLKRAEVMREACSPQTLTQDNPGVVLGVVLGICGKRGKNKVTLIASPGIHTLGAWLEQLLAESTGKNGKGLIPVDQEPLGEPKVYSQDRVFVYLRLDSAPDEFQDLAVQELEEAGMVVVRLQLDEKMDLGAELFRWEIATDVAGSILGIDPFNQPDVEESKVLTKQMMDSYDQTLKFDQPSAFYTENGLSLYTDTKNLDDMRNHLKGEPSLSAYLRAHLERVEKGDYVDLSAFIEMSDEHTAALQESRVLIRNGKKVATCLGFGPRFLHSTGQAYKGGPNTGVFIQITADHTQDIQVPGHKYSFGLVILAQAQADFTVLAKRSRRVLRIHLGQDVERGLEKLKTLIKTTLDAK